MDILLLCGYFEACYQDEIASKTKVGIENAANTFQQRLITGLKALPHNVKVVSAPFIGPWPTEYSQLFFNGFKKVNDATSEDVKYVKFNNAWGYRNISRTHSLKKEADLFLKNSHDKEKAVIVYCPHTPFLEAAVYIKEKDPAVHIHMVVPDLPQYMNLNSGSHKIYDFFKGIDIKRFNRLNNYVDSYTLLTSDMAEVLNVKNRPYTVVEALTDDCEIKPKDSVGKVFAYAGKLLESFGVKKMVEAFTMTDQSDAKLIICGGGELEDYIVEQAKKDTRIEFLGTLTSSKAFEVLKSADVLINPRQNDSEYTKYSFPSKNVEYLMTGNIVIAYMLDGMPNIYRDFIVEPVDNSVVALKEAMIKATTQHKDWNSERVERVNTYFNDSLNAVRVGERIYRLISTACSK